MDLAPSLLSRAAAFVVDVISNGWGLVGFVTTLLPVLDYLMPEKVQKRAERALNLASANRRLALVIPGAAGLLFAAFQAYDGANEKLRAAQAELAQLKSGEARQQQNAEAARRQTLVSNQLGKFAIQAAELWGVPVGRDEYPRWARHCDAFVAEVTKWVDENLGPSAKGKLLAPTPFPKLPGARLVEPSHRERLVLLDSISTNLIELMRDFAANPAALNPSAVPSPQLRP